MMAVTWLVSAWRRDASVVDPMWGMGLVGVAWLSAALNAPVPTRVWLMVALTTIWGLRLSLFLLWRNWGQPEDRRYAAMRQSHGSRFVFVSIFTVFLLQGLLLWLVALPMQAAAVCGLTESWGLLDGLGIAIWSVGLFFETVGDWQLARFQADAHSAGRVMDRGLWRYTRHPNYFGDFCVWWGIYLLAAAGGAWWTVASPLLMSMLLLRVSGVTLLEKTIVQRRPEYAAYQQRTQAFFPWWPKDGASS